MYVFFDLLNTFALKGGAVMLFSYRNCIAKFGTDYKIKNEIQNKKLFIIEKGIYSDTPYVPELDVIAMKYTKAIITLNSAFYYYGLTDTIPDFYYVATSKGSRKITDKRIKQIFDNTNGFDLGKTSIQYDGISIPIYNRERLLIELIRNKRKFAFDLYKELILSYREIIHTLDMEMISEYAYSLPKTNMVMKSLTLEVLLST